MPVAPRIFSGVVSEALEGHSGTTKTDREKANEEGKHTLEEQTKGISLASINYSRICRIDASGT